MKSYTAGECGWEADFCFVGPREPNLYCGILPLLLAAAGAALGSIPALTGANKSQYGYSLPSDDQLNTGQFDYEGLGQGQMTQAGQAAQARQGAQANYTVANQDSANSMSDRGSQADATNLYKQAAEGVGPSAAQSQMQAGIAANMAAQQAQAASARGTGAQRAAAQLQAISGASGANQQAANAAATLRAQEMQQGMAGYANAAQGQRTSDVAAQGADAQMAQYQANLNEQQNGLNDNMTMGYANLGQQASLAQQQGMENFAVTQNKDINAVQQGNAQLSEFNAAGDGKNESSIISGAMGGLSGMMGSDERMKTDIEPAEKQLSEFLEPLGAHSYEYKEPSKPGRSAGRKVSPMAQEMEKSEIGRSLISRGPDGMRMVDYAKSAPVQLSALAMLQNEVNDLKSKVSARGAK